MKRYDILQTVKRFRAWYYEGKELFWVEELIAPDKPFLYNLFMENNIITRTGRPVLDVSFDDALYTFLFYCALRGSLSVEAVPGATR